MRIVALALTRTLFGCSPSEDIGARLRRECVSIVREGLGGLQQLKAEETEALVRRCVDTRGRSGV